MNPIQGPSPEEPPAKRPEPTQKPKSETWVAVLLGVIGSIMGITAVIIIVAAVGILAIVGLIFFTCSTH